MRYFLCQMMGQDSLREDGRHIIDERNIMQLIKLIPPHTALALLTEHLYYYHYTSQLMVLSKHLRELLRHNSDSELKHRSFSSPRLVACAF